MSKLKKYVADKFTLSEDHADWDYPGLSEPVRVYLAADVEGVVKIYKGALKAMGYREQCTCGYCKKTRRVLARLEE